MLARSTRLFSRLPRPALCRAFSSATDTAANIPEAEVAPSANSLNFDLEAAVAIREEITEILAGEQASELLKTLGSGSDLPLAKWRSIESVLASVTADAVAARQESDPAFPLRGPANVEAVNFDTLCRVVSLTPEGAPLKEANEAQWAALLSAAYGTDEYVTRKAAISAESAKKLGFMYNQFTKHDAFRSLLLEKLNEQGIAAAEGEGVAKAVLALEQRQRTRALVEVLDPFLTRLYKEFGFVGADAIALMQKALSVHFVDPDVVAELTEAGRRATSIAGINQF